MKQDQTQDASLGREQGVGGGSGVPHCSWGSEQAPRRGHGHSLGVPSPGTAHVPVVGMCLLWCPLRCDAPTLLGQLPSVC